MMSEEVPDARRRLGLTPPDPVKPILDSLASKGPLTGGIVWPPEPPKRGDAHDDPGVAEQRGSGAHVTGPATPTSPTGVAGPDLDQAIHAATTAAAIALSRHSIQDPIADWTTMAKVAVEAAAPILTADTQALRDKVADLQVYTAKLREALMAIAAHHTDEIAFPGSPLSKVRDVLAAQPPQHRRQLLGYQTSDGRLYQPEDITLVYDPGQGEAQGGDHGG